MPELLTDLEHDLAEHLADTVRIAEQRLGLYGLCTCAVVTGCYEPAGSDGLCGYCHRWHRDTQADHGRLDHRQAA